MDSLSYWTDRLSLYVALLVAWVAMLGSLYFSEVKGYIPCDLCWYQRILMYPLTVILTVGLVTRDRNLPKIVLPLSTLGMFVSLYHYLLEKTDLFSHATVCRAGVSCTTLWINWLGFITIPLLALTAFIIITIMSVVALLAGEPDDSEDGMRRTWLPVSAIVAAAVIVFGTLFSAGWDKTAAARAAQDGFAVQSAVQGDMAPVNGAANRGAQLYAEVCAVCHGANLAGVTGLGATLLGSDYIKASDDATMLALIRSGRGLDSADNKSGLVMPASGGRPDLSDDDLAAIIAHIRAAQ